MNPKEISKTVKTVLIIDWPSKDVPEMLALAGFHVVVRGGPGPDPYSVYELNNGQVVTRHVGRRPERADLIYSYHFSGVFFSWNWGPSGRGASVRDDKTLGIIAQRVCN